MPLELNLSPDGGLAHVTGRGHADYDAFMAVMGQVAADPAVAHDVNVLADFSQLEYTPSFREIKKFASSFEQLRASLPSRVSIVVKDRVQLRLGRFAAMVAGMLRFEMAVFEEMDQAAAWLQRRKANQMNEIKAKVLELWSGPQLAALATVDPEGRPRVRYVMTRADEALTVRFATYQATSKVEHIAANPEVHLVAGVSSLADAERWVQISGRAEISTAEEDRRLAWSDSLGVFFKGPDDPGFVVGVVRPERIEYMEMGYTQPEVWRR